MRTVLATGGTGVIGPIVVRHLLGYTDDRATVLDNLAYAGKSATAKNTRQGQ